MLLCPFLLFDSTRFCLFDSTRSRTSSAKQLSLFFSINLCRARASPCGITEKIECKRNRKRSTRDCRHGGKIAMREKGEIQIHSSAAAMPALCAHPISLSLSFSFSLFAFPLVFPSFSFSLLFSDITKQHPHLSKHHLQRECKSLSLEQCWQRNCSTVSD